MRDTPVGTTEPQQEQPKLEWYVVHTYSGYVQNVKRQLTERVANAGRQRQFGDILVPSEQVVELVKGKKRTTTRNLFPGYILVQMELNGRHLASGDEHAEGDIGRVTRRMATMRPPTTRTGGAPRIPIAACRRRSTSWRWRRCGNGSPGLTWT